MTFVHRVTSQCAFSCYESCHLNHRKRHSDSEPCCGVDAGLMALNQKWKAFCCIIYTVFICSIIYNDNESNVSLNHFNIQSRPKNDKEEILPFDRNCVALPPLQLATG